MDFSYELESITPHTVANTTGEGRGNAGGIALRNFSIVIDSTMYVKTAEIFRKNLEKHFGKQLLQVKDMAKIGVQKT